MRPLSDLGVESREARIRLQLPSAEHAARVGIFEIARAVRPSPRRAHCQAAEVCQRAVANDGCPAARSFDPGRGRKKPGKYGAGAAAQTGGTTSINTKATPPPPPAAPEAQESY